MMFEHIHSLHLGCRCTDETHSKTHKKYAGSKYYGPGIRMMAVGLEIVLDVLSCGVVTARWIARRAMVGVMNALMTPPLRHRRLPIYQGE